MMLLVRIFLISFVFIVMATDPSYGIIHFNITDTLPCLNKPVEYQCTVTGPSVTNILTWRVFTDSSETTQLGSAVVYTSNVIQSSSEIGGVFTVDQSSLSPLTSTISFTVQSNINGYTIVCEDSNTNKNVTSIVAVPDNSLSDVIIHTGSFTNSSVNISWTESSSPCVTGYRYYISSSALKENIIMESTSNSVMVEGLVPSDDQYCVSVTAIELYSNSTTPEFCYLFNVPLPDANLFVQTTSVSSSTAHLIINWEDPLMLKTNSSSKLVVPDIIGYRVTISSNKYTSQSDLLPPNTINHTFTGVPIGCNYTVTVVTVNGVGDSVSSLTNYPLHDPQYSPTVSTTLSTSTLPPFVNSITTYPRSMRSFMATSSSAVTSCGLPTCTAVSSNTISDTNNVGIIVGASIGGVVVFIIVFLLIILTVLMVFISIRFIKSGSHTMKRQDELAGSERFTLNSMPASKADHHLDNKIWIAGEKGDDVVNRCIDKLQEMVHVGVFPDDKGLMRRIAYVMTRNGTCNQSNTHDGGIWQVSRYAFNDSQAINDHSRLRHKYHKISKALPGIKDWMDVVTTDMEIPMYSMLAARLYLSNFPNSIPMEKDIKEQQSYWWSIYMDKHERRQFMSESSFEEVELEWRIWIPGEKGDDIVDKCIEKLEELVKKEVFPDDNGLMRRIAYVMTRNGTTCDRSVIHNDGGIWQVSLHAFKDSQVIHNHIRLRDKHNAISKALPGIKDWMDVMTADREIPMYSMLAARLYLSNFPDSIPMENDIKEQKNYWWRFYMDKHEGRQFMSESSFEEALRESYHHKNN